MRTFSLVIAAGAICLLLTSCETKSVHPLSSPTTAQVDQQLLGDWHDPAAKTTYRFSAVNAHWMRVVIIPGKPDSKMEAYDLFRTVIGSESYLNVRIIDKHDDGTTTRSYEFVHYTISPGGVLQMWTLSDDAAAAAVRAGKLRGQVDEIYDHAQPRPLHPEVDVTLNDSSENLARYVGGTNIYQLFREKMNPLYRVVPAIK